MTWLNRLRDKDAQRGLFLISPTLIWMFIFLIIPLTLVVVTSFGGRDTDGNVIYKFTLDNYIRLMGFADGTFNDLYVSILWRSLVLAFQTTILVIIIGYPLAYFVARSPVKQRNLLLFLILIPLWSNFVIRIYAWIMLLRAQGVINSVIGWGLSLVGISFTPLDMYPSAGAVLVGMVYEFLPFMILPMYTSLEKIDPALYEAAADLGANAVSTFLRVTLPLSAPGMVAGTILVFIPVMGTFIVSDILGGRQVILVGNLIQNQFLSARDPAFGSAASIILMVMTLVITIFYARRFGFGEEVAAA